MPLVPSYVPSPRPRKLGFSRGAAQNHDFRPSQFPAFLSRTSVGSPGDSYSRMAMDVWEYFIQKQREWAEHSVHPDRRYPFEEEAGSRGQRGRFFCNLELTDDAFLAVKERVVVRGSGIHREMYAYSLVVDGAHLHGWAREPDHDPAEHEHRGPGRTIVAAPPIALCDCIDLAWEMASEQAPFLVREE
jgi:hypothetical protein